MAGPPTTAGPSPSVVRRPVANYMPMAVNDYVNVKATPPVESHIAATLRAGSTQIRLHIGRSSNHRLAETRKHLFDLGQCLWFGADHSFVGSICGVEATQIEPDPSQQCEYYCNKPTG